MKAIGKVGLIFAAMLLASASGVYAADAPQKAQAYLKPDVTIKVEDQVKSFYSVEGLPVFPIIYQGTTYLPIRAISELMGKPVDWDNASKTVYIGRSLSDPVGELNIMPGTYVKNGNIPIGIRPQVQMIEIHIMPNVTIMQDFEYQSFMDVTGRQVYPMIYQGSTYLPVRAAAQMMGEEIEWDQAEKLITISNHKAEQAHAEEREQESQEKRVEELKTALNNTVGIYDEATAKIANIQNTADAQELTELAAAVSRDSDRAGRQILKVEAMERSDYTAAEQRAYDKILEFAESSENYILVLENIAYMAASGEDYSVLAETFLNLAMDAQIKLDAAKKAVNAL